MTDTDEDRVRKAELALARAEGRAEGLEAALSKRAAEDDEKPDARPAKGRLHRGLKAAFDANTTKENTDDPDR